MLKNLKYIVPAIAVIASVSFISNGFASDKPEKTALHDYVQAVTQDSPEQGKSLNSHKESASAVEGLELSKFSIEISNTLDAEGIKEYEGKTFAKMLTKTDEKLWFMMNGDEAEGIVVANDTAPVKMGGKNRSKDLMKLYKSVKKTVKKDEQIQYVEFDGQGFFVVDTGKKESVYLSRGAAQLLDLPAGKSLSSSDVIEKMKKHVNQ